MTEATEFTIGSEVVCSEGACGELRRVVVNPVARALTHLVVEPRFQQGAGRLVPIELVESAAREIRLRCTMAEFHALEEAEETHFVQGAPGQWGYGQGQMLSLPLFALGAGMRGMGGMGGLGMGGMGMGGMGMGGMGMGGMGIGGLGMGGVGMGMGMGGIGMRGMGMSSQVTREDRVPEGDVEVRRGERVHATDGEIGRVHGFVIDPDDHHLTHVLLDEGHLWGKRTIAIPISAVKDVSDGVCLSITKAEVGDLPPVDLDVPQ
jgi:sporulation protein YlmC with PRC-barrel domain